MAWPTKLVTRRIYDEVCKALEKSGPLPQSIPPAGREPDQEG